MKRNVVCISIGAFTAKEARALIGADNPKGPLLFIFDPNPDVIEAYNTEFKNSPNVIVKHQAVGKFSERCSFYLCGQSSSFRQTKECDVIEVDVVTLASIVDMLKESHADSHAVLVMNCEGAEIGIIDSTSLEVFETFESIAIEFHHRISLAEDIQRCVRKLAHSFGYSIMYGSVSKNPRYTFRRNK